MAKYLSHEEYDTISLGLDLELNDGDGGNIALHLDNKQCMDCIIDMVNKSTHMIHIYDNYFCI